MGQNGNYLAQIESGDFQNETIASDSLPPIFRSHEKRIEQINIKILFFKFWGRKL